MRSGESTEDVAKKHTREKKGDRMERGRGARGKLALAAITVAAASMIAVGCTQSAPQEQATPEEPTYENAMDEAEAELEAINARQDEINREYSPEVRTLKDGTKVQRTPSEYECYHWSKPYWGGTSYNNYFLDADNRGCGACHEDLADTLRNMEYTHLTVWNDYLQPWITVDQCMLCHSEDDGYEMGTLMHAVHYGERVRNTFEERGGQCMSCHNMTEGGQGIELWDQVKYNHMDGIVKVEDVQGDFVFDQDTTVPGKELFTYDWVHTDYDHLIKIMGKNELNLEMPLDVVENWEINMSGLVNKPFTAKLGDLIKEAESAGVTVTKLSKMECLDNMPGAAGIGQVEITGIPFTWLLEKAGGAQDGFTGVIFDRQEFHNDVHHSTRGVAENKFDNVYLVYKIDGERLTPSQGAPCINWVEACDAQGNIKQCRGYILTDEDKDWSAVLECGFNNYGTGPYMNKPNVTVLKCPEGKIIETGKPFTFEGYADAFDEAVTTVEFSMDGGETWTSYDLGQTDPRQWVYWHYTWTPESDGSYVLMARGVTETGLVSEEPQKVMVTAKSNVEE